MKKVYFISGLGADSRIYSLLDLSFCEPVFVDWITPLPHETLAHYAIRLKEQIPGPHATVIGISFGGMLATEMAKADPSIRAILISSCKTSNELPAYFKAGRYIPVYKWISPTIARNMMLRAAWILGAKGEVQKKIIRDITLDTDIGFDKWAIDAILHWKNTTIPRQLIQIHGTADKLIPIRNVKPDHTIRGGTHVMPLDNHAEISKLLKKLIES